MKIALVDDHVIFLEGLKIILSDYFSDIEFSNFSNPRDFITVYNSDQDFQLIITDLDMPLISGAELITQIRKINPNQKVLVVSMHDQPNTIQNLVQLKINGYLIKNSPRQEIYTALKSILQGGAYFSEEVKSILQIADDDKSIPLTKREIEIVQLLAKGYNSNEVAKSLFISKHTIDTHRKNIIQKLELSNTAELIKWAIKNNITSV